MGVVCPPNQFYNGVQENHLLTLRLLQGYQARETHKPQQPKTPI
jgi:hypothetical protein